MAYMGMMGDTIHDFLVCDNCGAIHRDDEDALTESCECSRFKQRMNWATADDIERYIDAQAAELAALRARIAVVEAALRQYADRENWSCSDDEHDHRKGNCCLDVWCLDVWDMNANGYEVAQAALANTDERKETDA